MHKGASRTAQWPSGEPMDRLVNNHTLTGPAEALGHPAPESSSQGKTNVNRSLPPNIEMRAFFDLADARFGPLVLPDAAERKKSFCVSPLLVLVLARAVTPQISLVGHDPSRDC